MSYTGDEHALQGNVQAFRDNRPQLALRIVITNSNRSGSPQGVTHPNSNSDISLVRALCTVTSPIGGQDDGGSTVA